MTDEKTSGGGTVATGPVFNIRVKAYRLVDMVEYALGGIYIGGSGTNTEYDRINVSQV